MALLEAIMSHPDLQTVTMTLATNDAQELYRRFGFDLHTYPERQMIRPGSFLGP